MRHQKSLRDEKQKNRKQPKHHMGGACFHRRAKKIRNNHRQELRKDEVPDAELFAEFRAARLDGCFRGCKQAGVRGGQDAGSHLARILRDTFRK